MNVSTRRIGGLTAVAAILLVAVWYVALIRPQSAHMKTARSAYSAAESQISQLDSQIASLQALERQAASDHAKLTTLHQMVPDTPDLKDLLNQLHSLATGSGVQLTSLNPSAPTAPTAATAGASGTQAAGGAQAVTLSMNATGSYSALMSFFSSMASMPRTVVVDQVNLSPGSAQTLTATITARVFYAAQT